MIAAEGAVVVAGAALIAAAAIGAAALEVCTSAAATERVAEAVADIVREAALVKRPKNCKIVRRKENLVSCC
jgi:ribosomal protein L36